MAVSEDYKNFIKEQLSEFGEYTTKNMFGGVGYFKEGKMFAGIMYGKFCLKVGDSNRQDFIDAGMEPFVSKTKKKGMPYMEVPADILEDKDKLKVWADKAYEVAIKAKK